MPGTKESIELADGCTHERFTEVRACDLKRNAKRGIPIVRVTCSDCGKSVDDFTKDERKAALRALRERAT